MQFWERNFADRIIPKNVYPPRWSDAILGENICRPYYFQRRLRSTLARCNFRREHWQIVLFPKTFFSTRSTDAILGENICRKYYFRRRLPSTAPGGNFGREDLQTVSFQSRLPSTLARCNFGREHLQTILFPKMLALKKFLESTFTDRIISKDVCPPRSTDAILEENIYRPYYLKRR